MAFKEVPGTPVADINGRQQHTAMLAEARATAMRYQGMEARASAAGTTLDVRDTFAPSQGSERGQA